MMQDSDGPGSFLPPALQPLQHYYNRVMRQYQFYLDRSTPHPVYRWVATAGIFAMFTLRIVLAQGVSISDNRLLEHCAEHLEQWYIGLWTSPIPRTPMLTYQYSLARSCSRM